MAKKKAARSRRAVVSVRAKRRARTATARVARSRFVGLGASDKRLLGLAAEVIEEDQGLLRRLAER